MGLKSEEDGITSKRKHEWNFSQIWNFPIKHPTPSSFSGEEPWNLSNPKSKNNARVPVRISSRNPQSTSAVWKLHKGKELEEVELVA